MLNETRKGNKMYTVYNENGDVIEQNLTEEQLMTLPTKNLHKQTT